ncbi:MAG: hypothetical protein LBE36_01085 [Flavobacteriaceae bacterium]|nr:hypothetical protein [Flavobacteriaceae bacterium]
MINTNGTQARNNTDQNLQNFSLKLSETTVKTIKKSMKPLGIEVVNRM